MAYGPSGEAGMGVGVMTRATRPGEHHAHTKPYHARKPGNGTLQTLKHLTQGSYFA